MLSKMLPSLLASLFALPVDDAAKPGAALSAKAPPRIELAICLDTSGSMDGLIDAARQKIWSIVNDLALAEPTPKLRVALLTFGNDGHPAERGWVKVDVPFTEDLDAVSQQLFALRTNGGTELVARVLDTAARELDWSPKLDELKLVVVAGNESAEQDPVLKNGDACSALIERGIVVNSIYCGNPADELAPAWQQVAKLADGHFATIDQQNGTIVIETPFDKELASLSTAINATYLPIGAGGVAAWNNQRAQDANAEACNVVEQVKGGHLKLEDVKKEELPEKLRDLSLEAKQKCVDDAWTKRQELQKKIGETGAKRQAVIDEELSKKGATENAAFDRAVRDALRHQAEAKGLKFPEKKPAETKPSEAKPAVKETKGS
jgi:hypothetical protein